MKKKLLVASFLFISAAPLCAQSDSTEAQVQEDILEALNSMDPTDPDFDPERLTELLQQLASNPVNINNARKGDLLPVPGVDLRIAMAIVEYRKSVKPFETIEELLKVSGIG
ncbi:MAG TPA: helix-hairpin-helix domain-containing protein, partial [Balneolaceae bacterium]|nr:helix-hairpin-helix domain-containing protein [Balneolaceae bacterium]